MRESIAASRKRLTAMNRASEAQDPETINPPARKIILTPRQRGHAEAWGYSRGLYLAGFTGPEAM